MSPMSSFSCNGLPKKKKYKIVPNESKLPSNSTSRISSSAAPHTSNVLVPVDEMSSNELPKDRKDLLNFVSFLKINWKHWRTCYLNQRFNSVMKTRVCLWKTMTCWMSVTVLMFSQYYNIVNLVLVTIWLKFKKKEFWKIFFPQRNNWKSTFIVMSNLVRIQIFDNLTIMLLYMFIVYFLLISIIFKILSFIVIFPQYI